MSRLARWLDIALQAVTLFLLIVLTGVVLLGVTFRYSGNSLIWYDEIASVLLAWITFSGAALATMRNAHLGFSGLLFALPRPSRTVLFVVVELIFLIVFAVIGWAGWAILDIFGNETLISVRFVPRSFVQSILPVSAGLIILARLLTLPERYRDVEEGLDPEQREIETEIARAETELNAMRAGEPK
ncbi:TRAP transporter small permease [Aurantimonas sp. A3-2-R12]|uniref:TRAP transporter small permease n=1 Tax=Aurantimonas sp. A3-2-R12 TaxID=3114362 RepID=UPI002E1757C4|nr:TRAP transporter small permease [Aurantimonas sp. A3-2-R12]